MNELVRLLVELSEDPIRREEFLNDPEAVLGATDLSPEQRSVLLTRDPQKILELLGHHGTIFCIVIAIFVFLTTPPPHHPPGHSPHGEGPEETGKEGSSR
jgi:Aromatic-ring-opening dioxygenase LigAB, LigA subunit